MNKREASIISAYTGYLIGDFDEMCKYIEEITQRPVFTHELGIGGFLNEIHEKSKKDFMNIKIGNEENQFSLEELDFIIKAGTFAHDHTVFSEKKEMCKSIVRKSLKQKEMLEND